MATIFQNAKIPLFSLTGAAMPLFYPLPAVYFATPAAPFPQSPYDIPSPLPHHFDFRRVKK